MAAILFTGGQVLKQTGFIGVAYVRANNFSSDSNVYNLASLKRGTGGRSSFSGIVATVFGASGFVGRYVCNRLGKIGSQIIVPYRGDFSEVARLKVCGDLGQVLFCPFHLRDEESLVKCMLHSNVVINLIGRDWETKNFKFDDVHVAGAARIAKIAYELGVDRLIHLSALNGSECPEKIFLPKGSGFLASKYRSEQAVLNAFPNATIIRPADVYGQEDRFLRYYAHLWRHQGHWMPMWKKGECTIKQPVFVSDLATGIMNAIKDPETKGKTYEAVGPKRYYLSELVDWFHRLMRKNESNWDYKRYDMRWDPTFKIKVSLTEKFFGSPVGNLHWERLEREYVTDQTTPGIPTLEDLGVCLTPMENQVPWELRPFMYGLYYGDESEDPQPTPEPPKCVV